MMIVLMTACGQDPSVPEVATTKPLDLLTELELNAEEKDATEYTVQVNSAVYSLLDFQDTSEYENTTRGLIDAPEMLELKDAEGNVIWSQEAYSFLDDYEKAPDTVNPSLTVRSSLL